MPIYDYHCDHCGHTFSQVQSYTDATLEVCPKCALKPRKLMATPAIVFKGGGWYKTDSRPAQKDGGADGGKEGPAPTTAGADAKGDTTAKGDRPKTGDTSGAGDKADKRVEPATKKAEPGSATSKATATDVPKPAPAAPKREGTSS